MTIINKSYKFYLIFIGFSLIMTISGCKSSNVSDSNVSSFEDSLKEIRNKTDDDARKFVLDSIISARREIAEGNCFERYDNAMKNNEFDGIGVEEVKKFLAESIELEKSQGGGLSLRDEDKFYSWSYRLMDNIDEEITPDKTISDDYARYYSHCIITNSFAQTPQQRNEINEAIEVLKSGEISDWESNKYYFAAGDNKCKFLTGEMKAINNSAKVRAYIAKKAIENNDSFGVLTSPKCPSLKAFKIIAKTLDTRNRKYQCSEENRRAFSDLLYVYNSRLIYYHYSREEELSGYNEYEKLGLKLFNLGLLNSSLTCKTPPDSSLTTTLKLNAEEGIRTYPSSRWSTFLSSSTDLNSKDGGYDVSLWSRSDKDKASKILQTKVGMLKIIQADTGMNDPLYSGDNDYEGLTPLSLFVLSNVGSTTLFMSESEHNKATRRFYFNELAKLGFKSRREVLTQIIEHEIIDYARTYEKIKNEMPNMKKRIDLLKEVLADMEHANLLVDS